MKAKLLTLCSILLVAGCVTTPVRLNKLPSERHSLTGWIDINQPLRESVQVTVSILAPVDGQLLPLVTSRYQVSNLPLQYDFRQLSLPDSAAPFYLLCELRFADNPALQARNQIAVTAAMKEKIMLIPLPCFPNCQVSDRGQIK